jgi:hypothetical protein
MHDNDPEVLEREKQRNLSNTQHKTSTPHAEAPGWNEYLASTSEADVKVRSFLFIHSIIRLTNPITQADRTTDSIVNLQRKTIEHVRARYAPDDSVESREADYLRDAVEGPLSGALGTEDTGTHEEREVTKEVIHKETRTLHKEAEGGAVSG